MPTNTPKIRLRESPSTDRRASRGARGLRRCAAGSGGSHRFPCRHRTKRAMRYRPVAASVNSTRERSWLPSASSFSISAPSGRNQRQVRVEVVRRELHDHAIAGPAIERVRVDELVFVEWIGALEAIGACLSVSRSRRCHDAREWLRRRLGRRRCAGRTVRSRPPRTTSPGRGRYLADRGRLQSHCVRSRRRRHRSRAVRPSAESTPGSRRSPRMTDRS